MDAIKECEQLLDTAWRLFKEIPLGKDRLERLSTLKVKLHQPCELAIAGKVKAGKSSFLNALIGEDLAKVGDLETTATINRFCYGKPENPNRPVKVVWDDGSQTFETPDFMNSLQGHDDETLTKASQISYLEYKIENPLLRELILVDTPGTGAVVDAHQEVAAKYFNLREKHKKQTQKCTANADAVVYLMGGVPNLRDQSFLEDFRKNTEDGIQLNAVGVLSKVDIDAKLLENRKEQAEYLADSLKEQLCTVIPVSAGLYRAIVENEHLFPSWQELLKEVPADIFEKMLKAQQLFMHEGYSDIPVEKRKEMKGQLSWSIFRTIVSVLHEANNVHEATASLYEMANMDEVKRVVEDYFFSRSKSIRCARVMSELYELCQEVFRLGLYRMSCESSTFERWESFVCQYNGNSEAEGLLDFLKSHHRDKDAIDKLEKAIVTDLISPIEQLQHDILQIDSDFQMLKLLQNNTNLFSCEEYAELSQLFGQYGSKEDWDDSYINERLDFWRGEKNFIVSALKRQIIHNAISKYNRLNH